MRPWKDVIAQEKLRGSLLMAVFLVGSLTSAGIMAFAAAVGGVELGLRWSISPGKYIFLASIILLFYAILRHQSMRFWSVVTFACLTASTLAEHGGMSRYQWILVGLSLSMLAEASAFQCSKSAPIWTSGQWVIGTYVTSVFLYNLLNPKEVMTFFGGGMVE